MNWQKQAIVENSSRSYSGLFYGNATRLNPPEQIEMFETAILYKYPTCHTHTSQKLVNKDSVRILEEVTKDSVEKMIHEPVSDAGWGSIFGNDCVVVQRVSDNTLWLIGKEGLKTVGRVPTIQNIWELI